MDTLAHIELPSLKSLVKFSYVQESKEKENMKTKMTIVMKLGRSALERLTRLVEGALAELVSRFASFQKSSSQLAFACGAFECMGV